MYFAILFKIRRKKEFFFLLKLFVQVKYHLLYFPSEWLITSRSVDREVLSITRNISFSLSIFREYIDLLCTQLSYLPFIKLNPEKEHRKLVFKKKIADIY